MKNVPTASAAISRRSAAHVCAGRGRGCSLESCGALPPTGGRPYASGVAPAAGGGAEASIPATGFTPRAESASGCNAVSALGSRDGLGLRISAMAANLAGCQATNGLTVAPPGGFHVASRNRSLPGLRPDLRATRSDSMTQFTTNMTVPRAILLPMSVACPTAVGNFCTRVNVIASSWKSVSRPSRSGRFLGCCEMFASDLDLCEMFGFDHIP